MPHKDPIARARYHKKYMDEHRKQKYAYMRDFYNRKKAEVNKFKNRPCQDCGGWYEPWQMDFDHRDPSTKLKGVSNMRQGMNIKLYQEIAKCDLVCANCHRDRTYKRGQHDSKSIAAGRSPSYFLPRSSRADKA